MDSELKELIIFYISIIILNFIMHIIHLKLEWRKTLFKIEKDKKENKEIDPLWKKNFLKREAQDFSCFFIFNFIPLINLLFTLALILAIFENLKFIFNTDVQNISMKFIEYIINNKNNSNKNKNKGD